MGTLFLLNSCCEQAAVGVFRAFPLHFVQLQSNSRQFNMHDLHAATENCMKCGFIYETFQMCTCLLLQPEICENVYGKMCMVAHTYCFNLKSVKMCKVAHTYCSNLKSVKTCMVKCVWSPLQKNWAPLPFYFLHSTPHLL